MTSVVCILYCFIVTPVRPIESHSGAWGNILVGHPNIPVGPSGEKIFEFFFSEWCILVYFIFGATAGPPQMLWGLG